MSDSIYQLPIIQTLEPSSAEELAAHVKQGFEQAMAMYPLGGQTSLHYGLAPQTEGWGISTAGVSQIVDFPVKDLTITVGTGITMGFLKQTLASEGLMLPLDVPQQEAATLGGVIATNTNGPRRFGLGTVRDYVIGIEAVNGKGQLFHGGGRVVKNVAGYDFCKLLTGSMGTLGVITQATVKLKPIPELASTVVVALDDSDIADGCISMLLESPTVPIAVELLAGEAWSELTGVSRSKLILAIQLAGTEVEVAWSRERLIGDLKRKGAPGALILDGESHTRLWNSIQELPAGARELTIQVKTVSSGTLPVIEKCLQVDPTCTIQSDAGNGIVTIGFAEVPVGGIAGIAITELGPVASNFHGHVETLGCSNPEELTMGTMWGQLSGPQWLHNRIREQFDPLGLLNPGRFVYS